MFFGLHSGQRLILFHRNHTWRPVLLLSGFHSHVSNLRSQYCISRLGKKNIDSVFIWVPLVTGTRKFKKFYENIFYLCKYLHNWKLRLYKYEINENLPHWYLLPLGSITRGVFSQEHVTSSPSFKGFVQTWEQPPLLIEHLST